MSRPLLTITVASLLVLVLPVPAGPTTPRQDLPPCWAGFQEPLPVGYFTVDDPGEVTLQMSSGDQIHVEFEVDFGDGHVGGAHVTDQRPFAIPHTYEYPGQYQVTVAAHGTVDGVACANPPELARSIVVHGVPVTNPCIDRLPSEVTRVFQVGAHLELPITSQTSLSDYTVTVSWPFETTETHVVGEGRFAAAHTYTEPGTYRPFLFAQGVDDDGECLNPSTFLATVIVEPRLFGPSRTETAVAVSQAMYGDGQAGGVVLARQDTFPDALTGATAAVAVDGPVLLTDPASLHPATEAELQRVLPTGDTVTILGGASAVSEGVAERIAALGYDVQRFAGSGREATAAAIADGLVDTPQVILLATGGTFPDALLAGAVAARVGGAVLLTGPSGVTAEGRDYLDRHPGVPVIAVGQEACAAAEAEEVVAGSDVYDTAVHLAERFPPAAAGVGLASGESFPDGLAAGPYLARHGHALLLTPADTLPAVVESWMTANAPMELMVFGGTAAISVDATGPARAATGTDGTDR